MRRAGAEGEPPRLKSLLTEGLVQKAGAIRERGGLKQVVIHLAARTGHGPAHVSDTLVSNLGPTTEDASAAKLPKRIAIGSSVAAMVGETVEHVVLKGADKIAGRAFLGSRFTVSGECITGCNRC